MPQPLGTRTVGSVVDWVTEQFGDIANVQLSNAKLIRWTNMAILEICTRDPKAYQGKWTLNTVAGTNEYNYPASLLSVDAVKVGDRIMRPMSFERIQLQTEEAFTGERGTPEFYSQRADSFFLWPVPDSVMTVTVYGSAKPADVTVLGDILPLSDRFFPRICEYVMACAQELDEDYEASAARRTQFEDMMKLNQHAEDAMRGAPYPQMGDPDEEVWYFYA